MAYTLEGKRALVCGSSQGIGRASAETLAGLGAEVTLAARNGTKLEAVRQELPADHGQTHRCIVADWSDPEAVRQAVDLHMRETAPFDILVNNTGGPPAGPVFDAKPEEFIAAITRHVLCNQLLAQTLVPAMKEKSYGRIINIISTSVRQPIPGLGVSNTTRGAVASWAKTLSNEIGAFGITVNNVLPGFTETERLGSLIQKKADEAGVTTDQMKGRMMECIPAGRFGSAAEIAAMVGFLALPEAAYVNGVSIPVDGGRTSAI